MARIANSMWNLKYTSQKIAEGPFHLVMDLTIRTLKGVDGKVNTSERTQECHLIRLQLSQLRKSSNRLPQFMRLPRKKAPRAVPKKKPIPSLKPTSASTRAAAGLLQVMDPAPPTARVKLLVSKTLRSKTGVVQQLAATIGSLPQPLPTRIACLRRKLKKQMTKILAERKRLGQKRRKALPRKTRRATVPVLPGIAPQNLQALLVQRMHR
mmetsp:Transcript_39316/g.77365  ORF Transcript_39316/g.77365 Transcript_39316/m.77365 type:complete len:210 (-) Transcript_39316:977-1606(-)